MSLTMNQVMPILTEPLIRMGFHSTPEQAFRQIILDYINRQIAWSEANLRSYEQKYKKSFAEWSTSLVGQATVTEEDDWLEWEAILDMRSGWQQIKVELEQNHVLV